MNKILFWVKTIRSGVRISDKLYLLYIALVLVLTYKLKIDKIKTFHFRDVKIKNKIGIFLCRKRCLDITTTHESYEDRIKNEVLGNLHKNDVFVDIGAHVGLYTILVGRKFYPNITLVAIEPNKDNFEALKCNIKLNSLENKIRVVRKACYNSKKKICLYIHHDTNHSLVEKSKQKVVVEGDKLDNIVKDLGLKRVNFVKIDVECGELGVLSGMKSTIKKYRPNLAVECRDANKQQVFRLLQKYNYNLKEIDEMIFAYPKPSINIRFPPV